MVFNNPVLYVDVYGLVWSWALGGIGAATGATTGFTSSVIYESLGALRGGCFTWKNVIVTVTMRATIDFLGGAAFGAATGDPTALLVCAAVTGAVGGAVEAGVNESLGGNSGFNGDKSCHRDYQNANPNAFGVL